MGAHWEKSACLFSPLRFQETIQITHSALPKVEALGKYGRVAVSGGEVNIFSEWRWSRKGYSQAPTNFWMIISYEELAGFTKYTTIVVFFFLIIDKDWNWCKYQNQISSIVLEYPLLRYMSCLFVVLLIDIHSRNFLVVFFFPRNFILTHHHEICPDKIPPSLLEIFYTHPGRSCRGVCFSQTTTIINFKKTAW